MWLNAQLSVTLSEMALEDMTTVCIREWGLSLFSIIIITSSSSFHHRSAASAWFAGFHAGPDLGTIHEKKGVLMNLHIAERHIDQINLDNRTSFPSSTSINVLIRLPK